MAICDYHNPDTNYKSKIVTLYQIDGLKRVPAEEARVGDIVCVSGIENVTIGETLTAPNAVEPLPFVKISEPTVEMTFSVNDSPFAGREGKFVTSRHLRERLFRELLKDVSLRVSETDSTDSFRVAGRHRPFSQKPGKYLRPFRLLTDDNSGRIQIIVERSAFS